MADSKASIFDFGEVTEQFWQPCQKSVLDNETELMEHQFMTQKDMKIVPIFLLIGRSHIYKVTEDKLQCAPFITTHLQLIDIGSEHFVQLNSEEPQYGFRLTFRTQQIEIFTSDKQIYEEWKKQLKMKCLLEDFHVQYIVQKMIGKGSFAKVYLATRKDNGQQYAIKAFSKAFMQQQHKGLESLVNEMEIMRKVSHPNILKLYEVHETENSVYFIVEVISGGELLQRVRETGFLSNESLQKLAFNLLAALNHLHMQKIVHRDLKPENLLLRSKENSYEIIIADFGLAGILGTDLLFKRCGTPGFVAPEILDFYEGMEMYNEKCDVFSAGVILFILITGTQPFAGKDQKSILKANKECLVDYGDSLFKNAPSQLQDLVKQMLIKNPQNRLSSQQCLQHPYFKQLLKEKQHQLPIFQLKLEIYDNYKQALKTGSMESSIEQRSPQYNGQLATVDSISSNVSIPKEQKNQQQQAISKFSQYSNKLLKSQQGSKRDLALSDVLPIIKTESRRQIDLHRIAIKNNMTGQQKKELMLDQFEDVPVQQEQSQVGEMIKMYNSTRIINIPKLQNKKPSTPTNKKQDIL